MRVTIGLLLPRSDMFPTLAMDFLNGLKLAFKISGGDLFSPKLVIESVGNATGKTLLQIAEKMILQENVTLVISFCGIFNLKELTGIFNTYKKSLIHVDLGGNVLKEEHSSSYVIHHTLNLWQSSYFSGVYAANTLGKNAAMAISFYDGGYHLAESFIRGFTENGGKIVYTYVSPMNYKSESFETMIKGLHKANPDFIYMLFSYNEGNKIFEVFSRSPLNGKVPILAASSMTGEMNHSNNNKIDNMYSISSWAFDEETPMMQSFQTNYSGSYNDALNVISLLGYEVGLSVFYFFERNQQVPAMIGDFVSSLKFETPRGELTFSHYNETQVLLNKLRQFSFNGSQFKNSVVKTIDLSNQEELYDKFNDLPNSGWQNPYLIT